MVTHGAGRGAKLGFPTANLEAVDTLLPHSGVYAGRAWLNGLPHAAAIHLGPNPTFGEGQLKVEVHLIDHDETIYGLPLEVEFLAWLRGVERFADQQSLIQQLQLDFEEMDAEAVERAEALKHHLLGTEFVTRVNAIVRQVETFEFEDAAEALEQLKQELGLT